MTYDIPVAVFRLETVCHSSKIHSVWSLGSQDLPPLADSPELIQQCQRALEQNILTPEELFAFTVNGDYPPFAQSLQFMVQTTNYKD